MATLETLLSQQMIERLGWTLVHFVWQAAAVALLLAVVLRCFRRSSSNVRYVVSCLAMVLIVTLPLVTMSLVEVSRPVAEAGPTLDTAPMSVVPVEVIGVAELPIEPFDAPIPATPTQVVRVPWTQRAANALEPALPWLVSGWLLGVFGLSAWHLGGWAQLQRMKRRMVSQVAEPLHAALADLSNRLGVRRAVGLLESALVEVPTVVGWLKPVILLPPSALSGLSTEQLEAILAHELAHVRRCDYLVNLAQTVVEILGFYHPAVWWISHRIRDERENCCDDVAVRVCGDSRRYARALTCLEELRHRAPELALAASGGSLVSRIARLLGRPAVDNRRVTWLPGLIALLVVAILIPAALLIAAPNSATLSSPEVNSTGQMGSRDVERTRFVHRNVEGRVDREFGFEQLIREEGDHWIVAIPYSTQSVGEMRCHVRADRGELRFDGALNQPTPEGGTFRGNVVIEITSRDPNGIDECTLYLDEVTFSAQNTRFTSSGPVRLVSGATELRGRGLELSFDEPQDRSDPSRLTIIDGVGVQITPSGSLLSLGEPKTESSKASASRQPAPVRARTETADSRAPSRDEKPRVMLDIEPSADAADRQVLLSFTIAEIPSHKILDRETAILVRTLLATEAGENYTAPRLVQLRQPLWRVFREHLTAPNLSGDTVKAVLDLLVSNGYARIVSTPQLLTTDRRSARIILGNAPSHEPSAASDRDRSFGLNLDVTPTIRHARSVVSLGLDITFPGAFLALDDKTRTQRDESLPKRHSAEEFRLSLYRIDVPNERYAFVPQASAAERLDAQGDFHLPVLLVKATLTEPPAAPALAPSASEQATADAAREFEFVRTDPMVRELMQRIAQVEVELIEARQRFLPQNPEIIQKEQLLEALRRRLDARRHELQQEFDDAFATRAPSVPATAPTQTPQTASSGTVTATFIDTDLIEAITEISEQTKAKIAVGLTVKGERITARLSGASIDTALQTVLQDTASMYEKLGDTDTYIVFRPLSGTFQGTDLREALKRVAEQAGVSITWDATVGGEAWAEFEGVSLETALRMLLAGSPYVATRTPDGYAVTRRNAQPTTGPNREVDAVAIETRLLLVDPECLDALRRGLPIKGVTAPADVNALHALGDDLAEGRTPLLKPDLVQLLLQAVRQYTATKMLAAPKVTVLDGESASMRLIGSIGYVSGYREPNDGSPEPIPQQAWKEIGVRLDTTPQIIEDQNDIRLRFEMEISSLLAMQKSVYRDGYEYDIPSIETVTVGTEIVIPDSKTALVYAGRARSLASEGEPARPLLLLVKARKSTATPPEAPSAMQQESHPGDPGMGALPPGANLR